MTTAALIVAAGRGVRAGGDTPKQYRRIDGRAVIARTLEQFLSSPRIGPVCVAMNPEHGALFDAATADLAQRDRILLARGGVTRAQTVLNGLNALAEAAPTRVLIHDAARPFVSHRVIAAVDDALDGHDGACAAIPIVDALRREATSDGGLLCGPPVPRDGLWRAQTPQGFRYEAILAAHRANADSDALDDAEVARAAGLRVALVESEADNFKITRPGDFARADRLIASTRAMSDVSTETRMGTGFDVHAFGPGDHLMLCGVAVPHERGFTAHSDGDVGLHALTDAVLGAMADGDIGRWFPPSDAQWRGASSDRFLRHALDRAEARGFRVINLDVTLICERPKIGPHADAMRARIADIARCAVDRVSVKATTTERLGFPGRGEGVAAQAAASLSGPAAAESCA